MRRLFATALALGFTAAATARDEKAKTIEEKLLGTWKLVKSDAPLGEGFTFTITYKKGGEMLFTRTFDDKDTPKQVSKGTFKVKEPDEKNKNGAVDWKVKEGDEERGEIGKILKLTEKEFVMEDPEGLKETFERVVEKDEKKEDKKDK